jgi:hypothetical protein
MVELPSKKDRGLFVLIGTSERTEFMETLFSNLDGLIQVREIDKLGSVKLHFFKSLEDVKTYNPPNHKHVYYGVFTRSKRKGSKENCRTTSVLWADFDNMTADEAKDIIKRSNLPEASVLIRSGHGIHSYWLLEKRAGREIESLLIAISKLTGSDPQAAEVARVMRLPDTWNVKYKKRARCEVVEQNNNRYPLQLFIDRLGVELDEPHETQQIEELENSKMACIRLIAKGVGRGKRNFGLGKITAYLKQQGYSQQKAPDIVKRWNMNNTPMKPSKELTDEFKTFWHGDYKYLGCKFTNRRLDEINKQLCPIGECQFHATQSMQIVNNDNAVSMDNEIFKTTVYPKIKGLDIAIYSTIAVAKEIDREHLGELVRRHTKDRFFIKAINDLKSLGYIEIKKGIKSRGIPDKLRLAKKSNYGRGYTFVNNLLSKLYIAKELNDNEYKLLILLKHYSYGKSEVYPTIETMAMKLGVAERSVTRILDRLERQLYISRNYKQLDNGKTKLIIQLQF